MAAGVVASLLVADGGFRFYRSGNGRFPPRWHGQDLYLHGNMTASNFGYHPYAGLPSDRIHGIMEGFKLVTYGRATESVNNMYTHKILA